MKNYQAFTLWSNHYHQAPQFYTNEKIAKLLSKFSIETTQILINQLKLFMDLKGCLGRNFSGSYEHLRSEIRSNFQKLDKVSLDEQCKLHHFYSEVTKILNNN